MALGFTKQRAALNGLRTSRANVAPVRSRRAAVAVRAMIAEYPDPEFIEVTKANFPDKGVANAEEARVLFSEDGYAYLDVRPTLECEEVGRFRQSINVPLLNARRVYDPQQNKKVVVKDELDTNAFIRAVAKKFPNKEAKLLVGCSDGKSYSLDALDALDEAGYVNIVGLKGGYYAWFRTWDNNLRRRRQGEYAENYTHDGDSCGIHSSGAGFDKVDAIEQWVPPSY